ncbi:reverse transcriptase [Sesbania bispinosa]|nr:reverse transcriptase [Sesbania bispinosa]
MDEEKNTREDRGLERMALKSGKKRSTHKVVAQFWWSRPRKPRALLAKQAWRLYKNPNTLWARILKGIYFPDKDILTAKKGRGSSSGWSSLIQGRDILLKHGHWIVGDGQLIDIWKDNWFQNSLVVPFDVVSTQSKVNTLFKETYMSWDAGIVLVITHQGT